MKKTIRKIHILPLLLAVLLILRLPVQATGATEATGLPDSETTETDGTAEEAKKSDDFSEEASGRDITLLAVGDNLMHMGVVRTGQKSDGTFDYSFLFQGISDLLKHADIKIINQETPLSGNELGFSGYPRFNSPTQVGDSIAEAGFNVVLHSSNHSADQGLKGIISCASFWATHPEVLTVGIHTEPQEPGTIPLLTIDDVTFAVLNYTYGPNSSAYPSSYEGYLDMLCAWDSSSRMIDFTRLNPQVLEDIALANELADVVIVCPHWGTEYQTSPSAYQRQFALEMTQAGADLIIGTHPHVTQPIEWIQSENGNVSLCYYSLGNYVSTQKDPLCMLEALAWVTFHVDETGVTISPDATGTIPLVCHYTDNVRIENIYLLENYTEEQAASHGIRTYGGVVLHLSDLQKWSEQILGDFVLTSDQVLPPEPIPATDPATLFDD